MRKTLKIIFSTLLALGIFAFGEYLATNNIFNIFDDKIMSQTLESTSSSNVIVGEPTEDIINDDNNFVEVYKGNNDANNETNTLTLYQNKKYILEAKNADLSSTRIGWYEQDQNFVILHEMYYSSGDNTMYESPKNYVLIMYYTSEGTLNISSIFDTRTVKLFKLSNEDALHNASSTRYSEYTLVK